ncbi:GNAT family N-acetyltransferase [Kutzneria kofuensis]|uniref:Ribosomal protein S18 acetylase RimI-like enzyme n=1 Tax=Kutzneria kofuensis TaxID=103725 RepID=A0A7W9NJ73_9PSEU|nr:GNAT family N-acetyltransferase [Kutzneria kofuensis]MBB5895357.1 ribosomal protein S18 acetylase RimI-like enzyme [Kutzneria kofuensis]
MRREAERVEAAFVTECLSEGITLRRLAGGVVAEAPDDPGHFWTRAFGFDRQLTDDELLAILDFHQGVGELQLAPWALPPSWEEIREANGLVETQPWVKLGCEIGEVRHSDDTAFSITEIGPGRAGDWAAVIASGFGIAAHLVKVLTRSVGRPDARHFVAWDGAQAVGAACLYRQGDLGYLTTAATLASHRNRGIQSALITRRAKEAAADGCRNLVAETGKPAPGRKNSSFGNLTRAGLRPLHERRSFQSDSR